MERELYKPRLRRWPSIRDLAFERVDKYLGSMIGPQELDALVARMHSLRMAPDAFPEATWRCWSLQVRLQVRLQHVCRLLLVLICAFSAYLPCPAPLPLAPDVAALRAFVLRDPNTISACAPDLTSVWPLAPDALDTLPVLIAYIHGIAV